MGWGTVRVVRCLRQGKRGSLCHTRVLKLPASEIHHVFHSPTRYPSIEPPPLDKRNPKPLPKKLSVKIKPVEVCDMTKYVYLG